jgi:hypothetical protein
MNRTLISRRDGQPFIDAYLVHWIKHPDAGSDFERKTRLIRWLPGCFLVWLLELFGYDGIVLIKDETVIGHVFFQKHATDWRAFSVFIREDHRRNAYAQLLLKDFLEGAYRDSRIAQVRIGAGRDAVILHIWQEFLKGEITGQFAIEEGNSVGWIKFIRGSS